MHEYDAALKLLLQSSKNSVLGRALGFSVDHWLNPELPQVQTSRADLLGETLNGSLVHLELQSKNDDEMALRMVEYALRIYREFGKFPKQIVLYAGRAKMNMPASWRETDHTDPDFTFRYTLVDMRELDSEPLLASPQIEDSEHPADSEPNRQSERATPPRGLCAISGNLRFKTAGTSYQRGVAKNADFG